MRRVGIKTVHKCHNQNTCTTLWRTITSDIFSTKFVPLTDIWGELLPHDGEGFSDIRRCHTRNLCPNQGALRLLLEICLVP